MWLYNHPTIHTVSFTLHGFISGLEKKIPRRKRFWSLYSETNPQKPIFPLTKKKNFFFMIKWGKTNVLAEAIYKVMCPTWKIEFYLHNCGDLFNRLNFFDFLFLFTCFSTIFMFNFGSVELSSTHIRNLTYHTNILNVSLWNA